MKRVLILPRLLNGSVTPPPSKSVQHRAMICAALADGTGSLFPVEASDDILATIGALRKLGAELTLAGGRLSVCPRRDFRGAEPVIDCRESGSTLRFLIPVAAALGVRAVFTGRGRLPQRPLGVYTRLLPSHGVSCESPSGGLPLTIGGRLLPGVFRLPGDVSSQFITGLMLALPLLSGDSEIVVTTPLESSGYLDLTAEIMREYGVEAEKTASGYCIKGNQSYRARRFETERDWSQAAFWLVAGALGSEICCSGLKQDSTQGDSAIVGILRRFGVEIRRENGCIAARRSSMAGTDIDAAQIPDLVPVLAVAACAAEGETRIFNASRLRLKESDRLNAVAAGLNALGGNVRELEDGLLIRGVSRLRGGEADSFGDHRIAMSLAVASCMCSGAVTINGSECVCKSYPDFFEKFNQLGGRADVVDMG